MPNNNNLRQHLTLAVVILILAAALLVLTFIPRQPHVQFQGAPGGNGKYGTSMPFIQAEGSLPIQIWYGSSRTF